MHTCIAEMIFFIHPERTIVKRCNRLHFLFLFIFLPPPPRLRSTKEGRDFVFRICTVYEACTQYRVRCKRMHGICSSTRKLFALRESNKQNATTHGEKKKMYLHISSSSALKSYSLRSVLTAYLTSSFFFS